MSGQCPACMGVNIINDIAGASICADCGIVVEENAIVSEINFTETSSGAAAVAGSFIGVNATGARIIGPHGRTSGMESSEITIQRSLQQMRHYQHPLGLPDSAMSAAEGFLKLAHEYKFTKGRHIEHVIAVCLYMGCKLVKTSHMLIDFADMLRVNVFTLGSTYLKFMKVLCWPVKEVVDPSVFIARFVALLEFGEDAHKVAQDAIRIAARFKKDWIHEGRRTAGICGAAIYLAAQMNHYRRSIQEIVQVVKIADTTILKRLEEFSSTASAQLTVGDFKHTEPPTTEADPPAFIRAREREKLLTMSPESSRRGKKRLRSENDIEMEQDEVSQEVVEGDAQSPREDSPISVSAQLPEPEPVPRAMTLLQQGIFENLDPLHESSSSVPDGHTSTSKTVMALFEPDNQERGTLPAEIEVNPEDVQEVEDLLQSEAGQSALKELHSTIVEIRPVGETMVIEEEELLDLDEEELENYICTEEEAQLKERVWTEFNLDYLRKLAAKQIQAQTGESLRPKKKRKLKQKQAFVPGKTAFESVQSMVKNNKKFSKRINYSALKDAFPEQSDKEEMDYKDDDKPDDDEDDALRQMRNYGRDDEEEPDYEEFYEQEA